MVVAKDGNKIKVHYTGTLKDGSTFDSSRGREPLEFTLGQHTVVPGFENAIRGMKVGEKKKVTLSVKDAYGEPDEKRIQNVPIETLKKSGIEPEVGMVLGLQHPAQPGVQIPAKVVDINDKEVKIDLNHPLAGKELTFEIELVNVD